MAEDFYHQIVVADTEPEDGARDLVGGRPILAAKQQIPKCKLCNEEMMLFFQIDLPADFGLNDASGMKHSQNVVHAVTSFLASQLLGCVL